MSRAFLLILFTLSFLAGMAQTDATIRQKHFNIDGLVALDGYDPVTYFMGEPREGSDEITVTSRGITYYFSSEDNANMFSADPGKYEPAYGGWCAFAMGETGEKVKVDPETYKIIDGKLYLFYNFWGNNTLEDWNENQKALRLSADRNWKNNFR